MRDLAVLFKGNNPARLLGGLGVTLKLSLVSVLTHIKVVPVLTSAPSQPAIISSMAATSTARNALFIPESSF